MKALQFNKKSWHGILWVSTYGGNLPDNICAYFWSLLGAILLFPAAIIGHIINLFKQEVKAGYWALYPLACIILGCITVFDAGKRYFVHTHITLWYLLFVGFLVSIGILAILAILGVIMWYMEERDSKRGPKEKKIKVNKPNPLIEGFKSFKGKYCSKITWDE